MHIVGCSPRGQPDSSKTFSDSAAYLIVGLAVQIVVGAACQSRQVRTDADQLDGNGTGWPEPTVDMGTDKPKYVTVTELPPPAFPTNPGACRADWCWVSSATPRVTLRGVWGANDSTAFAVGDLGTILRFDGADWRLMESGTDAQLNAVWGFGASDVFVVGEEMILRYDGAIWNSVPLPATGRFYGIWGSGPKSVFVAGDKGVHQYDGTSWKNIHSDVFSAISGFGSDRVVAVGNQKALLFDGIDWKHVYIADASLSAVWAASRDDIYVGGWDGSLLHYDGVSWNDIASGNGARIRSIWGHGPSDVFACGEVDESGSVTLHYDGSAWTLPKALKDLRCVAVGGAPGKDAIFAGTCGTLVHYDGHAARRMAGPETGELSYRSVWGVGSEILLVPAGDSVLQCDNGVWRRWTIGPAQWVWGSGVNDIYLLAPTALFHFDGAGWKALANTTSGPEVLPEGWRSGLWGLSRSEVYLPSNGWRVDHFEGSRWQALSLSSAPGQVRGVWGATPGSLYAVGGSVGNGTIIRFGGSKKPYHALEVSQPLYGVGGTGDSDVYVVGDSGGMHYNGLQWNPCPMQGRSIWVSSDGVGFVAGHAPKGTNFSAGAIHSNRKGTWQPEVVASHHLNAVWGNDKHVYAVGLCGAILRSEIKLR